MIWIKKLDQIEKVIRNYVHIISYALFIDSLDSYMSTLKYMTGRNGNLWVVVKVKSRVKELTRLLMGCTRVNNQSEAMISHWLNPWLCLLLISFRPSASMGSWFNIADYVLDPHNLIYTNVRHEYERLGSDPACTRFAILSILWNTHARSVPRLLY